MAAERRRPRRRRVTGTIRFRVTLIATVAVAIVLLVAAIALIAVQRRQLTANLDDAIRNRSDELSATVAGGQLPRTLADSTEGDVLSQVVGADGSVVAAVASIAGAQPLADPPPSGRRDALRTVDELNNDGAFRVLSRRVDIAGGQVVVHVAGSLDDVRDSTRVLATSLAVAIPLLLVVLAALIWWLVGRTLSPVEAMRTEVADIGATGLHRRVPQPDGDDEIARLATTMNTMLDRVEDATRRQQRFVADASHELRSPLTRMRSELEVDIAHPDRADLAATHRSILDETTHLQRLVDDLLQLARADALGTTAEGGRREPVDLDDIVLRDARRLRADSRVQVDLSGVSAAQVLGDPDQLTRAVRNLIDNAARHASTTVMLALTEHDHTAVLTVADDGPGIPPEQHERAFERFTRLDDARSATTGGTGLGLAITRDIIERHGGSIRIDDDGRPGTHFTVILPTD
jgi:signal transduction histidine kinase